MSESTATRPPLELIGWLEALAEPTRLRLLLLVERQELGVADLCDVLQLPQSTVSRHLKVLADQGWLVARHQGPRNLYRATIEALPDPAGRLWEVARAQVALSPSARQDALRLAELLARREQRADAFFADAAGRWDTLRAELYGHAFERSALAAMLPPGLVVADLGCGTGRLAGELAPHVGRVIGVDRSSAMLAAAQQRLAGRENVELRAGSLEQLPLEDGEVDVALILLVLTYVEPIGPALREVARILRPGGRAIAVDLLHHDRDDLRHELGHAHAGFEPAELADDFRRAGLEVGSCAPLPPEEGARGPALLLATAHR
jgi:ArsR family transcriptional regulator